ncbi:MAG: 4-hydroxy-tetrahydrodipicolinate synthase [Lentisphaeria bacterium]|nr:4-hydroxy-tetrahydrodipicolinate synthase [Lentisphaeria bacterium]
MEFFGCYTAIVTPFKEQEIDYAALHKLVDEQIEAGVTGLVPVGTTGESPTLDFEEHIQVIERVNHWVNKRCQVIAGTGANSTAEAIHLSQMAAEIGVDATLQVCPYYNKPSSEGLYRHFSEIAEKSGLPIVLYNVPGRCGKEIPLDVVLRLSKNPLVQAVKEAGGSVDRVSAILNACDITVLSGDDNLALPMMALGAKGVISVASNLIPAEISTMAALALQGDFAGALSIHRNFYPLFRDLFIESNPIPVKAALAQMGKIREEYRLPLCEISQGNRQKLIDTLKEVGVV